MARPELVGGFKNPAYIQQNHRNWLPAMQPVIAHQQSQQQRIAQLSPAIVAAREQAIGRNRGLAQAAAAQRQRKCVCASKQSLCAPAAAPTTDGAARTATPQSLQQQHAAGLNAAPGTATERARQQAIENAQHAGHLNPEQQRAAQAAAMRDNQLKASQNRQLEQQRAGQAAAARENQLKASQSQRLEQERAAQAAAQRENQLKASQSQRLEQERAAQASAARENQLKAAESQRLEQERAAQASAARENQLKAAESQRLEQERAAQLRRT